MGAGLERAKILLENQEVRIGKLFSGGIMPIPRIRRFVSWFGKLGDKGGRSGTARFSCPDEL